MVSKQALLLVVVVIGLTSCQRKPSPAPLDWEGRINIAVPRIIVRAPFDGVVLQAPEAGKLSVGFPTLPHAQPSTRRIGVYVEPSEQRIAKVYSYAQEQRLKELEDDAFELTWAISRLGGDPYPLSENPADWEAPRTERLLVRNLIRRTETLSGQCEHATAGESKKADDWRSKTKQSLRNVIDSEQSWFGVPESFKAQAIDNVLTYQCRRGYVKPVTVAKSPDHISVLAPNSVLLVRDGKLTLTVRRADVDDDTIDKLSDYWSTVARSHLFNKPDKRFLGLLLKSDTEPNDAQASDTANQLLNELDSAKAQRIVAAQVAEAIYQKSHIFNNSNGEAVQRVAQIALDFNLRVEFAEEFKQRLRKLDTVGARRKEPAMDNSEWMIRMARPTTLDARGSFTHITEEVSPSGWDLQVPIRVLGIPVPPAYPYRWPLLGRLDDGTPWESGPQVRRERVLDALYDRIYGSGAVIRTEDEGVLGSFNQIFEVAYAIGAARHEILSGDLDDYSSFYAALRKTGADIRDAADLYANGMVLARKSAVVEQSFVSEKQAVQADDPVALIKVTSVLGLRRKDGNDSGIPSAWPEGTPVEVRLDCGDVVVLSPMQIAALETNGLGEARKEIQQQQRALRDRSEYRGIVTALGERGQDRFIEIDLDAQAADTILAEVSEKTATVAASLGFPVRRTGGKQYIDFSPLLFPEGDGCKAVLKMATVGKRGSHARAQ